jgi:hypothetical protein
MLRLTIALCLILAAPAAAKPGDLDRSFGIGGRIAFAVGDGYSAAGDMLLGGDGRVLLAGEGLGRLPPDSWQYRVVAARLTASGRLDSAFGSGGRSALAGPPPLTGVRELVAPLPGGGAVIAGATETHPILFRIDAAGRQVTNFGEGGVVELSGTPHLLPAALATRGDKILVLTTSSNPLQRAVLIRLKQDGDVENRTTVGTGVGAAAMLADARGTVVATTVPGYKGHSARVRLTTVGGRTTSFVLHSRGADHHDIGPVAIMRGPGRTLLVAGNDAAGGSFSYPRPWPWVVRIGAGGKLDRRFGRRGRVIPVSTHDYYTVRAATLDRRRRVVLAGGRDFADPALMRAAVMRITPAGRLDPRLGVRRVQIGAQRGVHFLASEARAVAIDARGRIVLAGVAFDDNVEIREDLGRSYFAVARLKG